MKHWYTPIYGNLDARHAYLKQWIPAVPFGGNPIPKEEGGDANQAVAVLQASLGPSLGVDLVLQMW